LTRDKKKDENSIVYEPTEKQKGYKRKMLWRKAK